MPGYDPEALGAGIVHIGTGSFHRAHQAVYIDDLLRRLGGNWRIVGVNLHSATARNSMQPQSCLYTLCEKTGTREQLRVIASIAKVLFAPDAPSEVVEVLAAASTKIVTLTATKNGYCLAPGRQQLDLSHPSIVHDILYPETPTTVLGFLLAACRVRRAQRLPGFNVICCDNLLNGGAILRESLRTAARLQDSALASWIDRHVGVCSSMVDCMVPAMTEPTAEVLQQRAGYQDSACVLSEAYRQWVIEDNFVAPVPDWSAVGVRVVPDVAPYEKMKIRLLNGGHSALAFLGMLKGYEYIHQAVADANIRHFVLQMLQEEVAPTLAALPGVNYCEYSRAVLARFANPSIPYRCTQVISGSSQKLPQRIFAPAIERVVRGQPAPRLAAVVAAWLACLLLKPFPAERFPMSDGASHMLVRMLQRKKGQKGFPSRDHVQALLAHSGFVPAVLLQDLQFLAGVQDDLAQVIAQGVDAIMRGYSPETA
ncbi:mannitol dehydrogenase family protein [Microbulbifer agarilyticus]